jgi:glycosyltransferase involved in cell wall biosynthesis/GT2 family glycosyltransferase
MIKLVNPRGRVVTMDERSVNVESLLEKGFVLADKNVVADYLPQYDRESLEAKTISGKLPEVADINFVTTLWSSNGMGRVGEEELLVLDKLGYKINVIAQILEKDGLKSRTLELLDKKYLPSEISLFYSIPEVVLKYKTKTNYLHTDWDTTKCSRVWADIINKHVVKVFASSDFTKKALIDGGVTTPIKIVKHGVNYEDFPYLKRKGDGTFNFMTSGDLSTRKGTDVLLNAFRRAFPNERDVHLIIKTNRTLEWGKLTLPHDNRIEIITDRLKPDAYLDLLRKAHCFVFPSRSEGFGLPSLEAMSTGIPTIIHNWSALTSQVNDRYGYSIGTSKQFKADPDRYPKEYGDIGDWGEPHEKELADTMRHVYENQKEAYQKGKKASIWVENEWTWEKPIKEMMADIFGVKESNWGEFYEKSLLTKEMVESYNNAHKELFWLVRGFYPETIIESGTGTGGMATWLTWEKQELSGKEPTPRHATKVIAVDNNADVLRVAKKNITSLKGKAELVEADIFEDETQADVIFSQGVLEHLSDSEMKSLVDHQLKQAPVVVHSIPNNDYKKLDYGNERLLPDEYYYNLFEKLDITILRYWLEAGVKKMSLLVFKRQPEKIKTSIIMLCYNNKDMTIKAIECVRKYTKDYELIVIDNGSTDGVGEWLDQQKDLVALHFAENVGVPRAKNVGMALAKGEYICFLDNDTEVGDMWLDTMLDVFKDKSVGFTAHEGYSIDIPNEWFLTDKITSGLIQWASGSCFLFPRKLLKQTGMLIDRDQWCVEDVDFCFKIKKLGFKGKLPDTPVNIIHLGGVTAKQQALYKDVERFKELNSYVWRDWKDFIMNGTIGAKVDLGSGDNPWLGYIHVDIQDIHHVDIVTEVKDLPFPDNSIEILRNSHLIEHLHENEIDSYLREWNRVLEPNGVVRIICPDFMSICKGVGNGTISVEQGMLWMFGGKRSQYDFHFWCYTAETLIPILERNGFTDCRRETNPNGWLQVSGKKAEPSGPRIGFFNGHHHVFGGGENLAYRTIQILQKNYPEVYTMSGSRQVDPKQAFGIEVEDITTPNENFDVFINYSHGKLLEPKGKKNIAFILYPQFDFGDTAKKYDLIVTQSKFVQKAIKDNWGLDSTVIYPPTDIEKFYSVEKKKQILCVGRFINNDGANNKNQDILVEAFKKLPTGWKLIFVGTNQKDDYYNRVKKAAAGFDIEFKESLSVEEMRQLYAESKILWHGAGYGAKNPSEYEHFGMVSVEALASGCRVLAYGEGGIIEVNGVESWYTIDELIKLTKKEEPFTEPNLLPYSIEEAEKKWKEIIDPMLVK